MSDSPSSMPPLPGTQPAQQQIITASSPLVVNAILKAYLWMFVGLLVTASTAFLFYSTGWLYSMLSNFPMLSWILVIAQLGLVMVLSWAAGKLSVNAMKALFVIYAFTMGISLASIFYVYTGSAIFIAFAVSALFFGLLCLVGFTTKKNMESIGRICLIGLLVLVISELVMMVFRISMDVRIISAVGLVLFTGITCWDVQRLNQVMFNFQGQPTAQEKWAILFAMELYLDFLNIFMYILQLLGSNSSNRR